MLSLLSRLTGGDTGANLKIRLQNDYIFLRGKPCEATEQPLSGVISLSLPSGQPADGVRLRMVGFLRCRDHDTTSKSTDASRTIIIFEHEWPPFVIDHGLKVPSDNPADVETHEWPFELMIPGDTPETFRGCSQCSITYQLTATTIRKKSSSSTPQAYRPIRISRTLQSSAFELMDAATVEGTWAEKMRYSISMAHQAVALGTAIPLEMRFTPLNKKAKIARIRCELVEWHKFGMGGRRPVPPFMGDRQVAEWLVPIEGLEEDSEPSYKVSQRLPLPYTTKKCSPDVTTEEMNTSHVLHVEVDVAEAGDDLFESRYHASLPVVLFISPKIPINACEEFVRSDGETAVDDAPVDLTGMDVPPVYGDHVCDRVLGKSVADLPC